MPRYAELVYNGYWPLVNIPTSLSLSLTTQLEISKTSGGQQISIWISLIGQATAFFAL